MSRRIGSLLLSVAALSGWALLDTAHAALGPVYDIKATWGDTNLPPGGEGQFQLQVRNLGDTVAEEALTITDQLPAGVKATHIHFENTYVSPVADLSSLCSGVTTVTCRVPGTLLPGIGLDHGYLVQIFIDVQVETGASGTGTNVASVTGPAAVVTRSDGGAGANEIQAVVVRATAGQFRLSPATATGTGTLNLGSATVTGVSALGAFRVGDAISGDGIEAGTTIAAVGSGTLTLSQPAATAGTVALTARETTGDIEWDASPNAGAGSVQEKLAALPGIGAGNIAVSGGPGDEGGEHPYAIVFQGALAGTNLPQMATTDGTVALSGGRADFTDEDRVAFSATPSEFGVTPGSFEAGLFSDAYPFGSPVRQAGDHPFEQRLSFDLNQSSAVGPDGTRYTSANGFARTVEATLSRGLTFNPEATPKCDPADFATVLNRETGTPACPADTQVGYINVALTVGRYRNGRSDGGLTLFNSNAFGSYLPIYNVASPKGAVADFAFNVSSLVQAHILGTLDPAHNYAVKAVVPNISASGGISLRGSQVTLWGVPGDPAHDRFRYFGNAAHAGGKEVGAPFGSAAIRPLITAPMDCGTDNGGFLIRLDSYEHPGEFSPTVESGSPLDVEGCEDPRFRFEPDIALKPTDQHAGAPTGLEVKLKVPQRNDEAKNAEELYAQNGFVQGISTPPIKKTVVTLPEGMTLNPSAGQGLQGCSLAQLGMSAAGVPNAEPVACPEASQIGTLILHSPNLPVTEPLEGRVYVARQGENPFGSLFALYLVLENKERGLLVKLAGRIDLNGETGQITTTFDDLPQFPVSDLSLKFKSGARAALVEPSTCGLKTITATYYSWQDPNTPHSSTNSYPIAERPDGSPCVNSFTERPFSPQLSAGTTNPVGGAFAPFTMDLRRTDEDQEISGLSLTLPPGLLAKIAGVQQCPESAIAQSEAPGRTGSEELASPSCPAGSQVGTVLVGTGTGASLAWVPGKVYFAGPYKGAPFSLVVITPSVVGPYDLGVVTVRNALYIDQATSQARVVSDPFPQILKGIPVRIRDVRVTIDRPQFMFNPTDCAELRIAGSSTSSGGVSASLSNRFQVANCATLAFRPKFTALTSGKTSRRSGASLDVRVSYPKAPWGSQANIAKVKVSLPRQLPSRLETLQKGCLDSVFDSDPAACPVASRVGVAVVHTPVLPVPLEGPAYFVSHGAREFPDLIVVLQGDGVTVDLRGETHISKKGITSTTYRTVPDVPFETFELTLPQGPYSALTTNGSLCKVKGGLKMPTALVAQNGMQIKQSTKIKVSGCPKPKRRHGGKRKKK